MKHDRLVVAHTATPAAPLCPVCGEQMMGSGRPTASAAASRHKPYKWSCSVSVAEHAQRKPMQRLVLDARRRSKKRGTAFDEEYMRSLTPLPCCEMCGVRFTNGNTGKSKGQSPTSRTLDEIAHGYGYVPGNVAQLCSACNKKKDSHTVESASALADWIEARRDQLGIEEWT